jgi:hypothetical protein
MQQKLSRSNGSSPHCSFLQAKAAEQQQQRLSYKQQKLSRMQQKLSRSDGSSPHCCCLQARAAEQQQMQQTRTTAAD